MRGQRETRSETRGREGVDPIRLGKMFALLYAIVSAPLTLAMFFLGSGDGWANSALVKVLVPLCYVAIGFLIATGAAWLYNWLAARGIDNSVDDPDDRRGSSR